MAQKVMHSPAISPDIRPSFDDGAALL